MIYLDASALVKLVVAEAESEALAAFVDRRGLVSAELALTEVPRAIWRVRIGRRGAEQAALQAGTERLLAGLAFVPTDRDLLTAAGLLPPAPVRALDAIHLASALTVADDLDAFVTYDTRQRDAAEDAGLPVAAPGLSA